MGMLRNLESANHWHNHMRIDYGMHDLMRFKLDYYYYRSANS